MNEIVERVAEAIQIAAECHLLWSDLSQDDAQRYRFQARAAIQALREPPDKMTSAVWGAWVEDSRCVWVSMIDAALQPEPRPATAGDV